MGSLDFNSEIVNQPTCRTCNAEENCKLSMYISCCERYPNGPAFEEGTDDYRQAVLKLCHAMVHNYRDMTFGWEDSDIKNREELEDIVSNLEQLLESET